MPSRAERLATTLTMLAVGALLLVLFVLNYLSLSGVLPNAWIQSQSMRPVTLTFASGTAALAFFTLAGLFWSGRTWTVKLFTLLLVLLVVSSIRPAIFAESIPQVIWIPIVAAFALANLRWMLVVAATEFVAILAMYGEHGAFTRPSTIATFLAILAMLVTARLLADAAVEQQRRLRDEAERSSENLRASEAKFSAAFVASPDYMAISTLADGRLLAVNDAFETATGYSRAEAIGRTGTELGLWATVEERAPMLRILEKTGVVRNLEGRLRRRDGSLRDCMISASPIVVDGVNCLIVTTRDVTEFKQSARALRASEAKFAELFRSSPLALALMRHGSPGYMDVNDAWLRLLRLERRILLERPLPDLGIWVDHEQRTRVFREADRETGAAGPFIMNLHRTDGAVLECQLSASDVLEFGEERFRIWAYADLTDIRRAQREVEELNASLERRVTERTRELADALETVRRAKDELVRTEKLSALGSLVAGVAHELNTPIGNVLVLASTLQDKTVAFAQEMIRGSLKRSALESYTRMNEEASRLIARNIEQAATLVASFKQVAVDQTSMMRRPFDLARTVEEVLATLHHLVRKTRIQVDTHLAPDLQLDSYPGPFGQVVTNLFTNALMHGFDGRPTGTIRIETDREGEDSVVIRFRDDGNGISAADLPRIFDPFFTTRMGRGGVGLGLHIVHNIVTNVLGGHIAVASQPGEGTLFTVTLPRVAPAGPKAADEQYE